MSAYVVRILLTMRVVFEVLVMVCAAASVTRLVAVDDITHPLRVWITWRVLRREIDRDRVDWCRWCAGWWVGVALAAGWWLFSDVAHLSGDAAVDIALVGFALRYTTGWLADREKD